MIQSEIHNHASSVVGAEEEERTVVGDLAEGARRSEGPVCLGLRGETFSDLPLLTGMAFFPFLCVVGLFESLWPPCWSSFRPQLGPESRPVFHPTSLRERGSPPPSTV